MRRVTAARAAALTLAAVAGTALTPGTAQGAAARRDRDERRDEAAPEAAPVERNTTRRRGDSSFAKGTREFHFTAAYYHDVFSPSEETILHGAAGVGYYFADRWAVSAQLAGYLLDPNDPGESSTVPGAGFDVLLRWHVIEHGRFSIFLEGGAGMIYSSVSIPQFGTHFNFTPQAAIGVTFRLHDNVHLVGAAKYFHLSNAAIQGRDENPGLDAIGGYVGLMWTF